MNIGFAPLRSYAIAILWTEITGQGRLNFFMPLHIDWLIMKQHKLSIFVYAMFANRQAHRR